MQLITTLKYWNTNFARPTIGSYLFEVIILNFVKSQTELAANIDLNIRSFFNYLKTYIYYDVSDPKGIQANIKNLTSDQRTRISSKAKSCKEICDIAIDFETKKYNQEKAIEHWRKTFGANFPIY